MNSSSHKLDLNRPSLHTCPHNNLSGPCGGLFQTKWRFSSNGVSCFLQDWCHWWSLSSYCYNTNSSECSRCTGWFSLLFMQHFAQMYLSTLKLHIWLIFSHLMGSWALSSYFMDKWCSSSEDMSSSVYLVALIFVLNYRWRGSRVASMKALFYNSLMWMESMAWNTALKSTLSAADTIITLFAESGFQAVHVMH